MELPTQSNILPPPWRWEFPGNLNGQKQGVATNARTGGCPVLLVLKNSGLVKVNFTRLVFLLDERENIPG